jgi:choline monooxygenase
VRYLTWVARPELVQGGAGADLDTVEREDEAVVERVQRGVRARLYRGGRFSPEREEGPHWFERLLSRELEGLLA